MSSAMSAGLPGTARSQTARPLRKSRRACRPDGNTRPLVFSVGRRRSRQKGRRSRLRSLCRLLPCGLLYHNKTLLFNFHRSFIFVRTYTYRYNATTKQRCLYFRLSFIFVSIRTYGYNATTKHCYSTSMDLSSPSGSSPTNTMPQQNIAFRHRGGTSFRSSVFLSSKSSTLPASSTPHGGTLQEQREMDADSGEI